MAMPFVEMMRLDRRGPDSYIGHGPSYPWGGLYGGQIVAQALVAGATTVDPAFRVHSLHAYFIRKGDAAEPIRFDVDRLRNGRNYVTRAVVASQSRGAILHMSASFQSGPAGRYRQAHAFPAVSGPDGAAESGWSPMLERRTLEEAGGRALAWLRIPGCPESDAVMAAAALAFLSDDLATEAVRSEVQAAEGPGGPDWDGVSLDHAIWFHHLPTGAAWQLHDFRCDGIGVPRGLAWGQVFGADGTHLATVAQEVLLRARER
jgi:acyl-CoA thioesterase-2